MRLHALTIRAFGPFADTVHVDFDELTSSGLFLLTGETGAGKSSVLDAVCFALYGEVPGDRHQARHLRCDQAPEGAEPRVELQVSVGERTFRFVRSPAWQRPKRRGHGTTRVQAHVVVEERRAHGWVALTNRLDEAGHLVCDLLGMTCTQFTQVAMLPQGRFQAFLRASSAERHAVLQRLFRTRRYEDVERWLTERRLELHRRSRDEHDRTCAVVSRVLEATASGLPAGWDLGDLTQVADDGSLETWHEQLSEVAAAHLTNASEALASTSSTLVEARAALDRCRSTAEARTRGEHASRTLAQLDASATEEHDLAVRLDAHRRAAGVLPVALRAERAERTLVEAEDVCSAATTGAAALLEQPAAGLDRAALEAAVARAHEGRAVAESWLPRERELQGERTRRTALAAETVRLSGEVAVAEERLEELESARDSLQERLLEARASAATRAVDLTTLEETRTGLAAARRVADLVPRLAQAKALLQAATDEAQELREIHLDLRERRIAGMAAELASGLAVGCSCPVCGSAEHPAPAAATSMVTRAEEEQAREDHETADFSRQAHQESVTTLVTRIKAHAATARSHSVQEWQRRHDDAVAAAERSADAERRVTELTDMLGDSDARRQQTTGVLEAARVALVERTREHEAASARCGRLGAELTELLATTPGARSVATLVERHTTLITVLDEARAAAQALDQARADLAEATSAAASAASDAGFGSAAAAVRAVLDASEATATEAALEHRRAQRVSAESILRHPDVAAALAAEPEDLDVLARSVESLQVERDRNLADQRQAASRSTRLAELGQELAAALTAWAPVRHEHALVARLAALVEGKSADNAIRMRLSAYVLGERLRQVVDAANERLGAMTAERYTLQQADEKGAGEQRGGLSLRVRDEWSGKVRDTATLSGGETFLVSLALALGLADTVSHQAGGTQLDTLFIDEGFGSLDANTLESVMDTLDSLRDGGRVVGLVSHVAELRNRVPQQLEVRKAPRGSTLAPVVVAD